MSAEEPTYAEVMDANRAAEEEHTSTIDLGAGETVVTPRPMAVVPTLGTLTLHALGEEYLVNVHTIETPRHDSETGEATVALELRVVGTSPYTEFTQDFPPGHALHRVDDDILSATLSVHSPLVRAVIQELTRGN